MPTAPYGSWKSPITADLIVSSSIALAQPIATPDALYWLEGRPTEGGRNVIVRRPPDGATTDLLPQPYNARTRVHEYGGADYLVDLETNTVYFANFADQHLYTLRPGADPTPLTEPDSPSPRKERGPGGEVSPYRFADLILDRPRNRLICVREDHTNPEDPQNTIAAIDLTTGAQTVLAQGHDFFAYPRLSPDGAHLAWIAWNHPNMPWDGTTLYLARLDDAGVPEDPTIVAGSGLPSRDRGELGRGSESVTQPRWSPEGHLYYLSDRTGFSNLYHFHPSNATAPHEPVCPRDNDFAQPLWQLGASTYDFWLHPDTSSPSPRTESGLGGEVTSMPEVSTPGTASIIATYSHRGIWRLARIDPNTGDITDIETTYTRILELSVHDDRAIFFAGAPDRPSAIVSLNLKTGDIETLKQTTTFDLDPRYVSLPQPIEYPTTNNQTAHAFYYPPTNPDYNAEAGDSPSPRAGRGPGGGVAPLLVMSHGGPTSQASATLRLGIQYWTSRGIGVLDVNYGGSTGFGRAYQDRLIDSWGIVDVDDCVNGALYLIDQGLADPNKLAITGGSAGGYTTLAALAFRDTFKAGASHYGVGDLEALAKDTHKFEARYLDNLIAPYPEGRQVYLDRSPIHHTEGLNAPVIFFQGLEDRIVPPNQAETMVAALRTKGVPVAYFPFEGEQHGFRRAENIKRSLETELAFYGKIFGFTPADEIEPFKIENL